MAETRVGVGETYVDISAWESLIDGTGGAETALVVTDITDSTFFNGFTSGVLTIKGDQTGNAKRVVTAEVAVSHILHMFDADISSLTVQDLVLDGTGGTSSSSGVFVENGIATLTLDRVTIRDTAGMGVAIRATASTTVFNASNCIFDNPADYAFRNYKIDVGSVSTFKNCLFTNCGTSAQLYVNDADITANYYNCVSFSNTGEDFANAAYTLPTISVTNCVSEDSTATAADHDNWTTTGSASGKTDLTAYFTDPTGGDYTLLQSDSDNWGINGSAANTPALDYASTTRVNDDIGPYEYVATVATAFQGPVPPMAISLEMRMARSLDESPYT